MYTVTPSISVCLLSIRRCTDTIIIRLFTVHHISRTKKQKKFTRWFDEINFRLLFPGIDAFFALDFVFCFLFVAFFFY